MKKLLAIVATSFFFIGSCQYSDNKCGQKLKLDVEDSCKTCKTDKVKCTKESKGAKIKNDKTHKSAKLSSLKGSSIT
jgi:hypothetical protein